jgi:hypothetical protein
VPLSTAFAKYTSVDAQVTHMLAIGEKSASLDAQLEMLSEMYEEDSQNHMTAFSAAISFVVLIIAVADRRRLHRHLPADLPDGTEDDAKRRIILKSKPRPPCNSPASTAGSARSSCMRRTSRRSVLPKTSRPESAPWTCRKVRENATNICSSPSSKDADELIRSLKENSQMYTTQIVDRDAWFVPLHRPEGEIRHVVAHFGRPHFDQRVFRPALHPRFGGRSGVPPTMHGSPRNPERLTFPDFRLCKSFGFH